MPGGDLRRHPRLTLRLPSTLHLEGETLDGRIENIGEGGAFFVTDTLEGSVEEGDRLDVAFEFDSESHRVPGVVLRVERYFHEGEL
ncbi:MAG: PilZ domain-containing protein, partial [Planctomycetota bacterium]